MLAAAIANADQPVHRTILRLREVMRRAGVGKSTIYDRMKKGQFPPQRKLLEGSDSVGWYEDEIDAYIDSDKANRPHSQLSIATAANARTYDAGLSVVSSQWAPPAKKEKTKRGRPQKPKGRLASEESGLMLTGIKIEGYGQLYLQKETGKLFGEIGCIPVSLIPMIVTDHNPNPPTRGSE